MLTRGYLIVRSRFLPHVLGLFLAIEGVCYLGSSFADFVAPRFAGPALAVLMASGLAEVALCLWLLLRGVNAAGWREQRRLADGGI